MWGPKQRVRKSEYTYINTVDREKKKERGTEKESGTQRFERIGSESRTDIRSK